MNALDLRVEATLERTARLVLGCLHREYPNKIVHLLDGDTDVRPPRHLTPMFYGSFDWHSAVHGHWSLVQILNECPNIGCVDDIQAALAKSFTRERSHAELEYLARPGRHGFEMPYGMAWLLLLHADVGRLARQDRATSQVASTWFETLAPLASHARAVLLSHIELLPYPIRTGEHNQTAFALGLVRDAARLGADADLVARVDAFAAAHFAHDHDAPLRYEPSGHDFLSPCLAEADLMRRVLSRDAFVPWLTRFLPGLPSRPRPWLTPVHSVDPADGKLAHLDGLNLSRAWMLDGIGSALPADDPRRAVLVHSAAEHGERGRAAVSGEHYAGAHWLGTFLVYWATRRGVSHE